MKRRTILTGLMAVVTLPAAALLKANEPAAESSSLPAFLEFSKESVETSLAAENRKIDVVIDVVDALPTVHSDKGQLQQLFLNIINNAFAAVGEGGHIEIGIERVGDNAVAVSITDDGGGIPEEHLSHIFDPFFSTKKGAGTGLGLSIVHNIVTNHGGRIEVHSRKGEGTTFTVWLPPLASRQEG